MKLNKYSFLLIFFTLFLSETVYSICTSSGNGNWTNAGTWSCSPSSAPPSASNCPDTIVVNHTVTVNDHVDLTACGPVVVIINGTLNFNTGRKLTLASGSRFIVGPSGTVNPGGGGGSSNYLQIGSNQVWNAGAGPITEPVTYTEAGVLPIKLIEFSVIFNVDRVDIKWITSSEVNNEFFTIERSKDALTWEEVIRTNGSGNSNVNIEYVEVDYSPFEGVSYYRLKQTDFDGNFEYFNIVPVKVGLQKKGEMSLFPNPIQRGEALIINLTEKSDNVLIVIRNSKGEEYFSKAEIRFEKNQLIAIPISNDVPAGLYIVTASSENQIYSQKLLVK